MDPRHYLDVATPGGGGQDESSSAWIKKAANAALAAKAKEAAEEILAPQTPPSERGVKQDGGVKQAGAKKSEPRSGVKPVKPEKRSADRHLEPNRDRHSPGYMRTYMREYMRRRRAAERKGR
jgi:hypothetical protein